MKEVKAFVHRGRVAEIVHALSTAGYRHLTVIDVRGLLRALSVREEQYSIELGERVTHEVRLEMSVKTKKSIAPCSLFGCTVALAKPLADGCM
jgi:nitrogen regulatory protein P-II 1